ncbi:mitochondrial distribution and morphology proteins-domain-containing protein [Entophlyctis helioformis]|nr:mitochondrial distribution and morphology proteins-domain-containing protein [Entophlyctis helioformis]
MSRERQRVLPAGQAAQHGAAWGVGRAAVCSTARTEQPHAARSTLTYLSTLRRPVLQAPAVPTAPVAAPIAPAAHTTRPAASLRAALLPAWSAATAVLAVSAIGAASWTTRRPWAPSAAPTSLISPARFWSSFSHAPPSASASASQRRWLWLAATRLKPSRPCAISAERSHPSRLRFPSHRFFSSSSPVAKQTPPTISQTEAARAFRMARQALINNVDGVGARMMLRIRLFLMGQVRPMKMDDIVALFSWIFVGNTLLLMARTTAFVSVVIAIVNSLHFQEYVAKVVQDYLTRVTGFNITFESAIVPRWSDGTLSLENVSIVCNGDTWTEIKRKEKLANGLGDLEPGEVDVNWTYWDMTVERIDISLSLWRLLDGRGPVREAKLKGVRGVVDRRHIIIDPSWVPTRRKHEFGDFEMELFVVEDLLLTVYNPNFRPFSISIFNAELPLFRKQWLLYDMMCADSAVGMFDNCLFSVHRPQTLDILHDKPGNWAKVSHLKMNALPIDHLNAGATGPLTWVTRGNVDLDMHLLIPETSNEDDVFDMILDELDGIREVAIDKIEEAISNHPERQQILEEQQRKTGYHTDPNTRLEDLVPLPISRLKFAHLKSVRHYGTQHPSTSGSMSKTSVVNASASGVTSGQSGQGNHVVMHCRVKLNDLKASVPILNPHLGYMSNALIRPVVGYMNANRTAIPLTFSVKMDVDNFNGAWDVFAAGLVDILSEETGRALTQLVQDERERNRRLRRIGIWSLQELGKSVVSLVEYLRGMRGGLAPQWA